MLVIPGFIFLCFGIVCIIFNTVISKGLHKALLWSNSMEPNKRVFRLLGSATCELPQVKKWVKILAMSWIVSGLIIAFSAFLF